MDPKYYAEAIGVIQTACNPSGVARFLGDIFSALSDDGAGTKAKCQDPAVRCIVAKLADLCGLDYVWPTDAAEEAIARGKASVET